MAAPCAFCGMKNAPREAVIDATFTIDPPPAAIRCGQAARVTRKTMSSSFLMVNDQSAKESSPIGPNRIADALLTRMSIPPARSAAASTHRRAPSSEARSTGAIASIRPPPARTSPTVSSDGLRVQVTAHHVGALPRAEQRRRPPDPAAGARDERPLASQPPLRALRSHCKIVTSIE